MYHARREGREMIMYCISSEVDCHGETEYRHRKKIFLLNSLHSEEIDFLHYPKYDKPRV